MTALIDTNVLVYRFDPRFPERQRIAIDLLRTRIASGSIRTRTRPWSSSSRP